MELDFDKMNGLIPAIIQDNSTSKVLMLGFMNKEAFDKTIETGKVTFFSLDAENKDLREVLLTQEIEGIPSLVFYKGGKQLDRLAGYKKADVLEKLIREVIK